MACRIEFLAAAAAQLAALPRAARRRVAARVDALASNPRPPGSAVLSSKEGLRRIRVGDYRVIYAIEDRRLVVLVVKIGHRREIYRRLGP